MNPPIVGLVLNYQDAVRTSRCLQSLLDDGAHAVLVWDNSEDGSRSVGELRTFWSGESRVVIVESPVNLGFAAGVNQGLSKISRHWPGTWTMLLNNDATLQLGALAQLQAALLQQKKSILAYPIVSHGGHQLGGVYYQTQLGVISQNRIIGSIRYASGCAMLIAHERFQGSLFDESFFMYGEDIMLSHRFGEAAMLHVPKLFVRHEGSASSGMGSLFYESRMVAAHWLLAKKLAGGYLEFAVNLLGRIVTLGLRSVVRSVRYRSVMPLRALLVGLQLAVGNDPALIKAHQASVLLSLAEEDCAATPAKQIPL